MGEDFLRLVVGDLAGFGEVDEGSDAYMTATIQETLRLRPVISIVVRHLTEPVLSQNRAIAVWRDAFQRFKTKKGARSSIEALLKRVDRGQFEADDVSRSRVVDVADVVVAIVAALAPDLSDVWADLERRAA